MTESGRGRILGTHVGITEERTGRVLLRGAVGDIAAHATGEVLAIASESRLRSIDLVDAGSLVADGIVRSRGSIAIPDGMRHGFRALGWTSPTELVVGMAELEGPAGQIGCWDTRTGSWKWRDTLDDFPCESHVFGVDIGHGQPGLIAVLLHLASTVLILSAADGKRVASMRIHESGGMLHMVSIDAAGESVAVMDDKGYCEIGRIGASGTCELRFALPFGGLWSFLNLGRGVLLGTEGGRVIGINIIPRAGAG